jgi:transposase-like protein/IS1 family transposase
MVCNSCRSECRKFGKHRNGLRRYQCRQCKRTFTEPHEKLEGMHTDLDKAADVLKLLVEGCSVSSVERITGMHHGTILKLLVVAGEKCEAVMGRLIRNVPVTDVQCDVLWVFIRKKEAHKRPQEAHDNTIGDAYTFVAIERKTKLVLNFALGRRDKATTDIFIEGLRAATSPQRFQITTDGFQPYINAIDDTLLDRVDYGMLIKVYAAPREGEQRYSPGEVVEAVPKPILGNPDPAKICTSHIERQNLTMRMQIRRLTRLTNAFSKKWANHWAALCLHFAWYNFCRTHKTIRVTPATGSGDRGSHLGHPRTAGGRVSFQWLPIFARPPP